MLVDLKFDWNIIDATLNKFLQYGESQQFVDRIKEGNGWEKVQDGIYLSHILNEHSLQMWGITNLKVVRIWNSFIYPYETLLEFLQNTEEDFRQNYGVCDNVQQVLEVYPELLADTRKFIVFFEPILKEDQPKNNGWRWHKWGKYIGEQNPEHEYLYDEPNINEVWLYHIVEVEEQ